MKNRFIILAFILVFPLMLLAQTKKAVVKDKPPAQSQMDKMMEEEMKGMSEEEKAEMRKMMKGIMPGLQDHNNKIADYPEFTSNKQLVPKREAGRIASIAKKKLIQSDMAAYATTLYNKLIAKGDDTEIALAKKIIAQNPKANDIGGAAVLCMLQGHPEAALALSMKAVQAEPSNANWQNNMASLLTQYGYPEQAIPVLEKLKKQFPENSTVLNNLGQAWLCLGEMDSAKVNIKMAGGLNPNHPEAKETEGVIEEVAGNTDKATENYVEAMEISLNPFTEMLIKNNNGQDKLDKIDFEKVKRNITIYEYFPKDWITIPELHDNVTAYDNNMRIKNGYAKMFEELDAKIEEMKQASSLEIEALLEGDSATFIKTMALENINGVNIMSKPAVIVQMILQAYLHQWMKELVAQGSNLMEDMNSQKMVMTKGGNDDKCADHDRRSNDFLVYANPIIRNFHAKKIEEFRMWLNAFCTWIWKITGNPKNTILTACISWTAVIAGMYEEAIHNQYAIESYCGKHNSDGLSYVAAPSIPKFTCPANVRIPTGTEWQQLSHDAKNFDNNEYGVKANPANPIPNQSIAYNRDHEAIGEAGKDPFVKSAHGSITPGIMDPDHSSAGQSEEILSNYLKNRSPDFKADMSSAETAATTVTDDIVKVTIGTIEREAAAKDQGDLFREYINSRTDKQKAINAEDIKQGEPFKQYIKDRVEAQKAALEAQNNAQGEWFREYQNHKVEAAKRKAQIEKSADFFRELIKQKIKDQKIDKASIDKIIAEIIQKAIKSKQSQKLLKKMIDPDCEKIRNTKDIQKEAFEKAMIEAGEDMDVLRTKGLQPTISTAMQSPGTFTPVKGLFN